MTDTSSKQKDADEVFAMGANALDSGVIANEQANDIQDRMSNLNRRWNILNIDAIEREKRLVGLCTFFLLEDSFLYFFFCVILQ